MPTRTRAWHPKNRAARRGKDVAADVAGVELSKSSGRRATSYVANAIFGDIIPSLRGRGMCDV
jgi:hypothetical protein